MCCDRQKKLFSVIITVLYCVVFAGVVILLFGRMYLVSSGKATSSYQGFDVDSEEKIYVGTRQQIRVIKDGVLVGTISPPTSSSYCFFIENETLYIGCVDDSKGGIYDLHGNKISYGEIRYKDVEKRVKGKTIFFNGHEYKIRTDIWESYKIYRDGEIVYQSDNSFFDGYSYWISLAFVGLLLAILTLIMLSILQEKR